MPKLSKDPIKDKTERLIYKDFCKTLSLFETQKQLEDFLAEFLTHTERKMLSKRFQIAVMLLEKRPYYEIQDILQVSGATISKVSNRLHTGSDKLRKAANDYLYEVKNKYFKPAENTKYAPGDLLSPAVRLGANYVGKKIIERSRKR